MTSWPHEPRGLHPATQWEHSPNWQPWESHPDPRRNVSTVWCPGGVTAATCSPALGVSFVREALVDANIRSIAATESGYDLPQQLSDPRGACDARGSGQTPTREVLT